MSHTRRTTSLAAALVGALALGPGRGLAANLTEVVRCTAQDGSIEFRQGPCDAHTQEQTLTIEDRPTGWEAPQIPAELLAPPAKPHRSAPRSPSAHHHQAAPVQARQCWQKRQRLKEVEWRLRQGYKPKQGISLKHKRESYEAYLEQFCEH